MQQNLLELWERYGDLLWETGKHKDSCRAYIEEIHRFMLINGRSEYNNALMDSLIVEFRRKGNRNSTINRKFASLSKLLRKHHRNGHLDSLPEFRKLPERNGRVRYLSYEEEAHLLAELEKVDEQYARLSCFLAETGARIGEALKLNWTDIEDKYTTFWETKSHHARTIPLSRRARSVVREIRGMQSSKIGPFRNIEYSKFRNGWIAAKSRTEMRHDTQVVPHVLRHTCASRLAQSGVDIKRIQEFLGHRTLSMTLRYAHLSPKHLDVCASALDNFPDEYSSSRNADLNDRRQEA